MAVAREVSRVLFHPVEVKLRLNRIQGILPLCCTGAKLNGGQINIENVSRTSRTPEVRKGMALGEGTVDADLTMVGDGGISMRIRAPAEMLLAGRGAIQDHGQIDPRVRINFVDRLWEAFRGG